MVKFDKDGWIIKQVIKMKVVHEEDHDRLFGKESNKHKKLMEKWLVKFLNKEVSKTEMYFIMALEYKFKIRRIKASSIMNALIDGKIKEINRFVKRKQAYSLNIYNGSYILFTPSSYFKVDSQEENILKFLNKHLNLIKEV